jgi:hypothetical protein
MVGTSTNHVRPIMIVKIHSVRNRHNFSTANIPCSNQKGWTTTTSNVVRKAPKITQLEHKKKITQGTSALIYRQGRSVTKKNMTVHPLSASTPAPSGRWWYRHRYFPGCHTNVNSIPFTQLPHKFSYVVA